jgi:hypothetical protein
MLKFSIVTITIFATFFVNAQTKLIPAKNLVKEKWLKNQNYEMTWFGMKDTIKFEIGKIRTQISNDKNKIIVTTQVSMNQMTTTWVDSSIADYKTLKPIRHSSYNGQRDMVLKFGNIVTGYYNDKIKKEVSEIQDTTNGAYFDSNLLQSLISWLPLKENYQKDISIYDYNPKGKIGVLNASVQCVKKGTYLTKKSGVRAVWIVSVVDEIGEGKNISTYYIDIMDRNIWMLLVEASGRKMMLELIES